MFKKSRLRRALSKERARGINDVLRERVRQMELGYTSDHDDQHSIAELVRLSHVYSHSALDVRFPSTARNDLVKAAAVLLAAIESGDRKGWMSIHDRRFPPAS